MKYIRMKEVLTLRTISCNCCYRELWWSVTFLLSFLLCCHGIHYPYNIWFLHVRDPAESNQVATIFFHYNEILIILFIAVFFFKVSKLLELFVAYEDDCNVKLVILKVLTQQNTIFMICSIDGCICFLFFLLVCTWAWYRCI